jgi:hypothetical protein
MTVYSRSWIRDAVARELLLNSDAGEEAAVQVTAQALAIDPETVREACESVEA